MCVLLSTIFFRFFAICLVLCPIFFADAVKKPLSPVILIPGNGGSRLEAQINKAGVVRSMCRKTSPAFFTVWVNLVELTPFAIDCWIDNLRLIYDKTTRKTSSPPGVTIRVPGWGDPEVVEWLEPNHLAGKYYADLVNALVAKGYERKVSIRAAPYDFRKGPNENEEFFVNLKLLVEETYAMNQNQPVTLIVHSMGGPMSLLFLQRQTAEWKDKYIARLISLAGAWAGSVKTVTWFAIGDNLDSKFINPKKMREQQITTPSLAYLLPSKQVWKSNDVLVQTLSRNYTIDTLQDFFKDLKLTVGKEMHKDQSSTQYTDILTPPGVEVHCMFGVGVATTASLNFKKSLDLQGQATLIKGNGDGTVNYRSLRVCKDWRVTNKKTVKVYALPKVGHMGILSDHTAIAKILDILFAK